MEAKIVKPALHLRLSQQLALTPQLQQAIRLLQLSSVELETELREALESNPLLELAEPNDPDGDGESDGAMPTQINGSVNGSANTLSDSPARPSVRRNPRRLLINRICSRPKNRPPPRFVVETMSTAGREVRAGVS